MPARTALAAATLGAVLAVALPAQAAEDRPFKASFDATTTSNLVTGTAATSGTATASHLGSSDVTLQFQFTPTGAGTFAFEGQGSLTAANGDELFFNFTGTNTLTPTGSLSVALATITGGTGRFAAAAGSFTTEGVNTTVSSGSIITDRNRFTSSGRISY
jgi:hypothetical protein